MILHTNVTSHKKAVAFFVVAIRHVFFLQETLTLAQSAVDEGELGRVRLGQHTQGDAHHLQVLRSGEGLRMQEKSTRRGHVVGKRTRVTMCCIMRMMRPLPGDLIWIVQIVSIRDVSSISGIYLP